MATTFVSGVTFGASMLAAGFHHPSIVVSQLKFDNWHMVQTFMTATAGSAAIYTVLERLAYLSLTPRSNSPLSLFSKYDGNIIGGSMLGIGMALSGACPGTLVVQMGAGVSAGYLSFLGAVAGGIIWSGYLSGAVKRRNDKEGTRTEINTLMDQTGLPRMAAFCLFEAAALALVGVTTVYTPAASEPEILGIVGGLLIAGAQLVSMLSRRSMLGISGSYEEMGKLFWWAVAGADPVDKPGHGNILFSMGVLSGAYLLGRIMPELVGAPASEPSPVLAVAGGILMVIGSRTAGGCTSGHGISGLSLLSTSSVVTIASAFAAGRLVATVAL
ncbi:Pfam:DUF395 [Geosmithia morbida]|uniref:Pfam:DUF395 n=1 Tax=Geosmithia morbida TaxID=1094350 RepID=A0A9P4Z0Z3_9HYPO|nr:Pfam:DUF395 [Geosmithia morbida]KAF4126570.1 Pfam:DUF395 [Geosmithia morbida]